MIRAEVDLQLPVYRLHDTMESAVWKGATLSLHRAIDAPLNHRPHFLDLPSSEALFMPSHRVSRVCQLSMPGWS